MNRKTSRYSNARNTHTPLIIPAFKNEEAKTGNDVRSEAMGAEKCSSSPSIICDTLLPFPHNRLCFSHFHFLPTRCALLPTTQVQTNATPLDSWNPNSKPVPRGYRPIPVSHPTQVRIQNGDDIQDLLLAPDNRPLPVQLDERILRFDSLCHLLHDEDRRSPVLLAVRKSPELRSLFLRHLGLFGCLI